MEKIFFFNSLYVFEINGELEDKMRYDNAIFIIFTIKRHGIGEFISYNKFGKKKR